MNAVSNTTVLSNFAGIGQLDVLQRLFGVLYISTDVYEEIAAGLASAYRFYESVEREVDPPQTGGWLRLTGLEGEQELRYLRECPPVLHTGEASCIAIARHRNWLLLTDDRDARREARRLGLRLSGTIGTLVAGVERKITTLDEANSWLQEMIRQRYRSPIPDLTPLVRS
jgi:predicted nucleic acid-binding protein